MTSLKIIESITDLLEAVDAVHSSFANQPWWRGHGRSAWELVPHVHRIKGQGTSYEANIAFKFSRMAPTRYPNCPPPDDGARWLVLMQHYRLPTRLLDWTESPLVALYFAVANDEDDSHNGAIWALDPFLMNELQGYEGILKLGNRQVDRLVGLAFSKSLPSDMSVIALAPDEVDMRMLVQLSGMTIHGSRESL